jgi:glutamate-1-semialdehyde 2,1-aminomutase
MGTVAPAPGFLQQVKRLTHEYGALLIFDEVMTGFRLAYGGAQELYGIKPDLTCLGKVIGGGLPVGAYGGKKEFMNSVAPDGPVYQAGTLSGNPLAVSAGIATLRALQKKGTYAKLESAGAQLAGGLEKAAFEVGATARVSRVGSMFTVFFTATQVTDFRSAKTCDTAQYGRFFHALLDGGVYFAPSQFEACFISLAHSPRDIQATVRAASRAFAAALSD